MAKDTFALKHLGQEPVLKTEPTSVEIIKIYNWYNYFCNSETALKYTIDYLKAQKTDKEYIKKVNKLSNSSFPNFIGWIFRQIVLGSPIPSEYVEKAKTTLDALLVDDPVEEDELPTTPVNIQARVKSKTNTLIGDIETEIDKLFLDFEYKFDCYKFLTSNQAKPTSVNEIVNFYLPFKEELSLALDKADPQFKEAYSYLNNKQLKKAINFIDLIISDCKRLTTNAKTVKKPRAKKIAPLSKQVEKLAFRTDDPTLKIVSVNPTTIIESYQLWVYNTKTRFLGVYTAVGKGLGVKGTSIINYDEKLSVQKRLRKPEESLQVVLGGSKLALRKLMGSISTREQVLNGRISKDVILLKVIKNG